MAKLLRPHERIMLITARTARELGQMFLRPQEFYESPSKRFRGKYFTHEAFARYYKRAWGDGHFTYYGDYRGYNFPGEVFTQWAIAYAGRETLEEQALLTLVGPAPAKGYYVIGAVQKDLATIEHEISHALFHICAWYRELACMQLGLWNLEPVRRALRKIMYREEVLDDECIAYILFDDAWLRRQGIATSHFSRLRKNLQSLYNQACSEYISPRSEW